MNFVRDVGECIFDGAAWALQPVKDLCADTGKLSDFLKIFNRAMGWLRKSLSETARNTVTPFTNVFEQFTGVSSFFAFPERIWRLVGGPTRVEGDEFPSIWKMCSTTCAAVGDLCSIAKWLQAVGSVDLWITHAIANIAVFGHKLQFPVLQATLDTAIFSSGLLSLIDHVTKGPEDKGPEGGVAFMVPDTAAKWMDITMDVTKIAAPILFNLPFYPVVLSAVALTVGSVASLSKFFIEKGEKYAEFFAKKFDEVTQSPLLTGWNSYLNVWGLGVPGSVET